ncbi:MAG TPA: extracellular solute-binding protein, partial [Pseudonocardiaceae bacterium]|nr:extracellular solute-binding protein [Pseudonocardiaceae bacterium]
MRDTRKVRFVLIAALVALAAAACTSGGSTASNTNTNSNTPQTLTWWHNGTAAPLLGIWQQVATDYHTAHPNVTIKVDPIQNEQFTTKVPLALQSSSPPSLYQQWGYGQEATQIKSGKLTDLTGSVAGWLNPFGPAVAGWQVNGKQYGVPYDLHVVGFWYRKDLFATAGITSP